MTRQERSFPTGTPAPAIRCRSSQGFAWASDLALRSLSRWRHVRASCPSQCDFDLEVKSEENVAYCKAHFPPVCAAPVETIDVGNATTATIENLHRNIRDYPTLHSVIRVPAVQRNVVYGHPSGKTSAPAFNRKTGETIHWSVTICGMLLLNWSLSTGGKH